MFRASAFWTIHLPPFIDVEKTTYCKKQYSRFVLIPQYKNTYIYTKLSNTYHLIPPIKRHGQDTLDVHGKGVLPDAWFGTGTTENVEHREAVFGSSHGAMANFLRADGTVTLITADVNWTTMWQLGKVNDGAAVAVP
jgi:hypothetical protein